jgi:hypothetical protein
MVKMLAPAYSSLAPDLIKYSSPQEEKVFSWHTVKHGLTETLDSIAKKYQIPIEKLTEFNFPGSVKAGRVDPDVVNWYLFNHVRTHCRRVTHDGSNYMFTGGEKIAIPYLGKVEVGEPVILTQGAITCVFNLNSEQFSILGCHGEGVPPMLKAFSGRDRGRDNPNSTGLPDIGPIPKGTYYIIDRQSGGHLGWLHDISSRIGSTDHSQWFMLWNKDTGDTTYVNKVKRGAFRLHPIGPLGLSEGCITVTDIEGFKKFAAALRKRKPDLAVPGTTLKAYGIVQVL